MEQKKFYITTAITYTSRKPHIGNTYEVILTDAIARYKRLRGYDVFFLTGTDEHGQKVQQNAEEAGVTPKQYVDGIAGQIRDIWDLVGASYDKFIRTTDDYHVQAVQKIFKKLYDKGDIYKDEYEGWYCTPCEAFFTETQLVDGKCPDCGREVAKTKEEAYFFKMSKYQKQMEQHIEKNPDFIVPESRKREMVNNFLKPGLQDLCVSRSSFSWGVPVSFDEKHVIYVWIDALSNYITALGYSPDKQGELYQKYWPADVHVIGKDILRFHTIYWPIILMALGEPLPKQVFGHPWLLFGEDKMSKSKGNVIYADDLVRQFGVDATRFYVLSEMPYAQDGSISYENIIAKFNSELANTLGNLVNRTVAMVKKYFDGEIFAPGDYDDTDRDLIATALQAKEKMAEKMDSMRVADAIDEIWTLVRRSNKYIDETMPWVLAKDENGKERLKTVLYNLIECIRFISVLVSPFMPQTAERIAKQINAENTAWDSLETFGKTRAGSFVGDAEVLFARLDEKKKLEEIQNEMAVQTELPEEEKKPQVTIDDFAKLDLRVAKVLECSKVEKSDKLLLFKLQLKNNEIRQVVSGIAKYYQPKDLIGKNVIMIANLKPVKLRGILSEGMILSADNDGKYVLLTTESDVAPGSIAE